MTPEQLKRLPAILFEIGKAIGSDEGPHVLFETISQSICDMLEADACSVMLLDGSRKVLQGKAAYGLEAGRINELSFRVGEGVAGWVVENGTAAVIDDCSQDHRFVVFEDTASKILSMACVPIVARGEIIGALTATSSRPGAFSESEADLLGFVATTIALDVQNIRLRKVSVTDPLTGAFNREFLQQIPDELERARTKSQPFSVAMVDVDHFKTINDRFGHDVGDVVLAEVARRLRSAIRSGDILVRYGGEEFLAVLPGTDLDDARDIGERMRTGMQAEAIVLPSGDRIEVRVSVGVAQHQHGDATALIRRADTALYRAKGRGRNRVEVET